MKKKNIFSMFLLIVFILITLVACKSKVLPEHSNVIDSMPNHIIDIVEIMKTKNGTYVFNPDTFGTDPDTYIVITHNDLDKTTVTVGELAYDSNALVVTLVETEASSNRDYSVIKLSDYNGDVILKSDKGYEALDTSNLYFTTTGSIYSLVKEDITIGVSNYPLVLSLSDEAITQIEQASIKTNDDVIFEYIINEEGLSIVSIKKIINQASASGKFIGYADSHTVEVKIGDEYHSYQISAKAAMQLQQYNIKPNQEIDYIYIELELGHKILKELK